MPTHRRVNFDTIVAAMALTVKEMNAMEKRPSQGFAHTYTFDVFQATSTSVQLKPDTTY